MEVARDWLAPCLPRCVQASRLVRSAFIEANDIFDTCASFPACLDAWWDRSVDPRSWITLIGRDKHRQYRTAQAKAYPSRLNAAIAEAFVRRVQSLQTNPMVSHFSLGTDFVDTVAPVLHAQTTSGSAMGTDYAPGPLR